MVILYRAIRAGATQSLIPKPFTNVVTFRESLSKPPIEDAVPNLKPGILDRTDHAVISPGASECEQVAAGFQDAERFACPCLAPRLEHLGVVVRVTTRVGSWPAMKSSALSLSPRLSIDLTQHRRGIPLLPHKADAVRRIGHNRVYRSRVHPGHDFATVPDDDVVHSSS